VHQMKFLPRAGMGEGRDVLAVSTEDGRVLFYDVKTSGEEADEKALPKLPCVAQLGGSEAGITSRTKDFELLELPPSLSSPDPRLLIITANSDGGVRLWTLSPHDLAGSEQPAAEANGDIAGSAKVPKQVGRLLDTLETGNRITCLGAFVMDGAAKLLNGATNGTVVEGEADVEAAEEDASVSEEEGEGEGEGEEEEYAGLGD